MVNPKNFIEEYGDKIPWEEKRVEHKSFSGILNSLPELVFIPAVKDVSEEAKVGKKNPFGQLINSVLEKIPEPQKNKIIEQLEEVERLLNRSEESKRVEEVKNIEKRLTELMSDLMDCDIEIKMPMPQLSDVFKGAEIYANDGVRTTIETKGHGLQRSMIFTILRAYAEFINSQEDSTEERRTTIFLIEEPELYLHPQSQRTLAAVLQEIANGEDQIIYSTHSGLFVDISRFDEICIMRREKVDGMYESYPTQLPMETMIEDLKARKGADATERGMREQYSHCFNPMVNEGFFADKVVLVEGPSEQYMLPIFADALDYNLDRHNVSVVYSDGKGQMDRLFRIFNGFGIPTYLWFDGDKHKDDKKAKDKTLELLELLDDPIGKIEDVKTNVTDHYAVLEYDLETTLKVELGQEYYEKLLSEAKEQIGPSGKPLRSRFIANKLNQRVDNGETVEEAFPATILDIVKRVRNLTYFGNILASIA